MGRRERVEEREPARRGGNRMRFGVNLVNFGPGAAPDSLARWG